ncbi:hypothetical protein WJX72_008016 [[Myrmecia] bisecta]|uniref:Protection of telomeres protein 1 n=1 Tax=[Myrmecia] bisecta TaxID=41462 RepID=A0AAW1PT91_9CHLO
MQPTDGESWALMPAGVRRPPYDYLTLEEADRLPPRAPGEPEKLRNFWAVVAECSAPRPTKGTDWVCNITVTDPTTVLLPLGSLQGGVEVLVFGAEAALPRLRKIGDIIRLHRISVNHYHDKLQLVGKVCRPLQYCLFEGDSEDQAPYQTSSSTYTHDEHSRTILASLRAFQRSLQADHPGHIGGSTAYLRRIKDVRPKDFFDIVCRVLAVEGDSLNDGVLHVWDGTDAMPFPPGFDSREGPQENLGSTAESDQAWQSARPRFLPLQDSAGILVELPVSGTALPIVMFNMHTIKYKDLSDAPSLKVPLPAAGAWVKLRNVGAWVVKGQLQGFFHASTKWAPWQPDQEATEEHSKRIAQNNVAGWAPGSLDDMLARTQHTQPFASLRQVQSAAGAGIPRKFRCLARIIEHLPEDVRDFCSTKASCGLPREGYMYTVKLRLQDATAELDVLLFGEDGATFFQAVPPQDLHASPDAAGLLEGRASGRASGRARTLRRLRVLEQAAPMPGLRRLAFAMVAWLLAAGISGHTGPTPVGEVKPYGRRSLAASAPVAPAATGGANDIDKLLYNQVQFLGTFQSHHVAPPQPVLALLSSPPYQAAVGTQQYFFSHLNITSQLAAGIRGFEFKLLDDPGQGGKYAQSAALKLAGQNALISPDLQKPGIKVMSLPDRDIGSTCYLFKDCIGQIAAWSSANPNHFPVTVVGWVGPTATGTIFWPSDDQGSTDPNFVVLDGTVDVDLYNTTSNGLATNAGAVSTAAAYNVQFMILQGFFVRGGLDGDSGVEAASNYTTRATTMLQEGGPQFGSTFYEALPPKNLLPSTYQVNPATVLGGQEAICNPVTTGSQVTAGSVAYPSGGAFPQLGGVSVLQDLPVCPLSDGAQMRTTP